MNRVSRPHRAVAARCDSGFWNWHLGEPKRNDDTPDEKAALTEVSENHY
jgi:hypothetical protein